MMKTINRFTNWTFYLGWLFSGVVSFVITLIISIMVSILLIEKIVGDTIVVAGQTRITQDYMLAYAFIPWFGMVIGVLQYLLLSLKLPKMGWWVLTTTLGWSLVFLGLGLRYNPLGSLRIPNSIWYSLAAGTILGLLMGLAQWMILREHVPYAAWWIPTNMLGFGIAGLIFGDISGLPEAMLAFSIPSFTTGVALWLFLDILPPGKNKREIAPPHPA